MPLSASDWDRLDRLFNGVREDIKDQGSKVRSLEGKVQALELGSPHKCTEEILKHESGSWSHNPKKALSLAALMIGVVEGIRTFFHKA